MFSRETKVKQREKFYRPAREYMPVFALKGEFTMEHPDTRILERIVSKAGTPTIVYDEKAIAEKMRRFKESLHSNYFITRVLYASKAFICDAMARLACDNDLYFDAVSGGEVDVLQQAGVPAERIYFHGNNKTAREITDFFQMGRGHIVVDNKDELSLVKDIANGLAQEMDILIRVNPGVEAHTHEYIKTATKDSKFGISIDAHTELKEMLRVIKKDEYLFFKGFHAHIGSQIFEPDAFEGEVAIMGQFIDMVEHKWDVGVEELDLGGGFAIAFTDEDHPTDISEMCRRIIGSCEDMIKDRKLSLKVVSIEPGRSMVGDNAFTLYTAGNRKKTETKEFLFVDGGMADNIRPALYQAEYTCDNLTKEGKPKDKTYVLAGKCCESGDVLIKEARLPATDPGDLIIVYATGAYGYSMASNYNRLGRPAVVFLNGDDARLVLRRETYEDMRSLETDMPLY